MEYRQSLRKYAWEYLSTHPCVDCGKSDPAVLEFDHVGEKNKDVAVIIGQGSSLETLKREIDLCEVRCATAIDVKLQGKEDSLEGKVRPVGFEPTTF